MSMCVFVCICVVTNNICLYTQIRARVNVYSGRAFSGFKRTRSPAIIHVRLFHIIVLCSFTDAAQKRATNYTVKPKTIS